MVCVFATPHHSQQNVALCFCSLAVCVFAFPSKTTHINHSLFCRSPDSFGGHGAFDYVRCVFPAFRPHWALLTQGGLRPVLQTGRVYYLENESLIPERRPVILLLQGYAISFLITNFHMESMWRHKVVDFIIKFMEEVDSELRNLKIKVNSRSRVIVEEFMKEFI